MYRRNLNQYLANVNQIQRRLGKSPLFFDSQVPLESVVRILQGLV